MAKARIKYMKSGRHSRTNNNITKIVRLYRRNLGLHGKFYFYKLYGGWLLEKVSQTYNYVYIYTYPASLDQYSFLFIVCSRVTFSE